MALRPTFSLYEIDPRLNFFTYFYFFRSDSKKSLLYLMFLKQDAIKSFKRYLNTADKASKSLKGPLNNQFLKASWADPLCTAHAASNAHALGPILYSQRLNSKLIPISDVPLLFHLQTLSGEQNGQNRNCRLFLNGTSLDHFIYSKHLKSKPSDFRAFQSCPIPKGFEFQIRSV